MNNYEGLEMLDFQYKKLKVEKFSERYNAYLVIEENMPEYHRLIMKDNDIEMYLSKQEEILACKERSEKREQEELKRQQEEEFKINNTWGYADNFSPMQKGKVLKILNKTFNYYDNEKYVGNMTRKEFIKKVLEEGYILEHKTNINYFVKGGELKVKPNEYRLTDKDGQFYTLTKTEYDFGNYLIKNIIDFKKLA